MILQLAVLQIQMIECCGAGAVVVAVGLASPTACALLVRLAAAQEQGLMMAPFVQLSAGVVGLEIE